MNDTSSYSLEFTVKQEHLQKLFEGFGKIILSLLLTISFIVFVVSAVKMVMEFIYLWQSSLQTGIQAIVVDTLTLLALFEIYLTFLTYFKESRVKVTFVVDSVFIILLSELMKIFFSHQVELESFGFMIAALLSLTFIRLLAIRYSPSK